MSILSRFLPLLLLVISQVLAGSPSGASTQDTPQFRAEVDQVVLYVSVHKANSELVGGLTEESFKVFEDRIEQTIISFAQTEVPSTMGIVLDSSGSMRNKQVLVEEAVNMFLDLTDPRHELFLVHFDDEVELAEDFTRDREDIRDTMRNIVVKGGTALYDATYLSVDKAESGNEVRKVVVVFTDGEDRDSYYEFEELLDKVQESETQVFIVAFLDAELSQEKGFFGIFKSEREKVQKNLTEMAEVTGGTAFFPERIEELGEVFQRIARDLKNQYQISYQSSNPNRDGSWRRIDVVVETDDAEPFRVRARRGYYARQFGDLSSDGKPQK